MPYTTGMHRLVRDTIVAVAAGIIVGIIVSLTTSLSRLELVGVFIAALAVCALVLGAIQVPGIARRRVDAFKTQIITEATSAALAEFSAREITTEGPSQASGGAILAASKPVPARELSKLFVDGRILLSRLSRVGRGIPMTSTLRDDTARWEALVMNELMRNYPDKVDMFRSIPTVNIRNSKPDDAYNRMGQLLGIVEYTVQEAQEYVRKSPQSSL